MTTETKKTLPANPTLTDLRHHVGFTVREVAERMGLTHPRIVQFESSGVPYVHQVEKLARIYGVSEDVVGNANKRTMLGKQDLPNA